MGVGGVTVGVWVSSVSGVEESWVGFGVTLAVVVSVVSESVVGIRSVSLGGGVESLGDWVESGAGSEGNSGVVGAIQDSRVGFGISVTLSVVNESVAMGTGDWNVGSVDARSALESYSVVGIGSISSIEQS